MRDDTPSPGPGGQAPAPGPTSDRGNPPPGQAAWPFELARDAHGRLTLHLPDGTRHADVHPVRAYPLSDPDGAVAILGTDGHERLWIADARSLPPAVAHPLQAALAERSFMPQIQALSAVSTFSTPSDWTVVTDRGTTTLVLNAEEDIRRLPDGRLLVTDAHGVAYLIRQPAQLDRRSRRLLERFL